MAGSEATVDYCAISGILAPNVQAGYSWPMASEEEFLSIGFDKYS
jgi:hypothetical protein